LDILRVTIFFTIGCQTARKDDNDASQEEDTILWLEANCYSLSKEGVLKKDGNYYLIDLLYTEPNCKGEYAFSEKNNIPLILNEKKNRLIYDKGEMPTTKRYKRGTPIIDLTNKKVLIRKVEREGEEVEAGTYNKVNVKDYDLSKTVSVDLSYSNFEFKNKKNIINVTIKASSNVPATLNILILSISCNGSFETVKFVPGKEEYQLTVGKSPQNVKGCILDAYLYVPTGEKTGVVGYQSPYIASKIISE
jgi:hypothetical protein